MCESPIIHVHTTVLYMHVQDHVWTRSNDQQTPMSNSSCHHLVPACIASPAEVHCLVVTAKVEALCHPVPVSSHPNQMSFELSQHSTLFRPFDISLSPRAAVMPACCTSSRKQAAKVPCQDLHHIIKTVFSYGPIRHDGKRHSESSVISWNSWQVDRDYGYRFTSIPSAWDSIAMQSNSQEVLTLQRCCHGIVMLMRQLVEAFCVKQNVVITELPQLPQDLAWQRYAHGLNNFHIFIPLLHSCIEPGLTEMLDSATNRKDYSMIVR